MHGARKRNRRKVGRRAFGRFASIWTPSLALQLCVCFRLRVCFFWVSRPLPRSLANFVQRPPGENPVFQTSSAAPPTLRRVVCESTRIRHLFAALTGAVHGMRRLADDLDYVSLVGLCTARPARRECTQFVNHARE